MPTQAQRQKWEATMSKKLDPETMQNAMDRRIMMTENQHDPLMETGAGMMDSMIPGSPGGLLDETMGPMMNTTYQSMPFDLER